MATMLAVAVAVAVAVAAAATSAAERAGFTWGIPGPPGYSLCPEIGVLEPGVLGVGG